MTRDEAVQAIARNLGNPAFFPHGKETFCNEFVRATAAEWGAQIPDLMANQIIQALDSAILNHGGYEWGRMWGEASASSAQSWANQGFFVMAVWLNPAWPADGSAHGHVAVVCPTHTGLQWSNSLKALVPAVASVGETIEFGEKLSWAFSQPPRYFVLYNQ